MATETDIKKIRIIKGTKAQIEAYSDLQPTDLVFPTDAPELQEKLESGTNIKTINGGSVLGSGDIELATKSDVTLKGVQVNGTDLTIDANKKVDIPIAGINARLGCISIAASGNCGYSVNGSSGLLTLYKATDAQIEAKSNNYCPVVPANLNKAVMEGLGNTTLTWTDTYKSQARATIGAGTSNVQIEVIDWE